MAKYFIHTYPKRLWYVENFLIPSMLEQGISRDNIRIWNDELQEGNLRACMRAFSLVDPKENATWHLQDDICICRDFKRLTEIYDDCGIVCGFGSEYDKDSVVGAVPIKKMWFSFPCIHIPNQIARGCAEWVNKYLIGNLVYKSYWDKGVNDDWCFKRYMETCRSTELALNLAPNLVEHIDVLIGGCSDVNKKRDKWIRSQYWYDEDIIVELEKKLKKFSKNA